MASVFSLLPGSPIVASIRALAASLMLASPGMAAAVDTQGPAITVDGRPFFVRGAAGTTRLADLEALGANTVRTYGGDPGPILAEAERAGLKVIVGLWLEHPRRGFDYRNRAAVAAQLEDLRAEVARYKNHPALLMWGIGNEVEAELDNPSLVWPAIEEAARMVKALDPNHPTMAVLQEAGADKARKVRDIAPSIDVLGVNSYAGAILTLATRVRAQGWTGPLVITELGVLGQWQAGRTPWGAPIELTSTEKAALLRRYLIESARSGIAGQIVFYWGQKQEATPTWHGLFLPTGEWTEPLESMAAAWGGSTPAGNRAPRIKALRLVGGAEADNGSAVAAVLDAADPDGDRLDVRWRVLAESTVLGKAGDAEPVPTDHSRTIRDAGPRGARLEGLPPGAYRLFVTVRDRKGAAATGNLSVRIRIYRPTPASASPSPFAR